MSAAYTPPEIHNDAASRKEGTFEDSRVSSQVDPQILWIREEQDEIGHVNLGTLFDSRFVVLKPIPVVLEHTGSEVIAVWPEIDEFGSAESAASAYLDLAKSIRQLYQTLSEERHNLGSDLQRVWEVLNDHLKVRASNAQ